MNNALVLGAGKIGRAIAKDLSDSGLSVVLVDQRGGRGVRKLDVLRSRYWMERTDVVVSAVPYRLNFRLTKMAIQAGCHFCDLGGNTEMVEQQLKLAKQAEQIGVSIVPDCGMMPGTGGILAGDILRHLGGKADEIRVRDGGLPQNPKMPFNYQLVFSEEGLLHEYKGMAQIIHEGKLRKRKALTGLENHDIFEAFHAAGMASTMPKSFLGSVNELDVKTIRFKGHVAALKRLGINSVTKRCPVKGQDFIIMSIWGRKGHKIKSWTVFDMYNQKQKLTAMMRVTGFAASIIAQMAVTGQLKRGVVLQELHVPSATFVDEMRTRGIQIEANNEIPNLADICINNALMR